MKLKTFLILLAFLGFGLNSYSQDYINAVGLRLGLSNGITGKHFISTNDALEGIFTSRWSGFNLTGLYERHKAALDVDGLYFFFGAGAHIGFWDGDASPWFSDSNNYTVIGIDGIIGLEYIIDVIPFNVSLDYKPGFNLIGYTGFWGDELALSFRYMF